MNIRSFNSIYFVAISAIALNACSSADKKSDQATAEQTTTQPSDSQQMAMDAAAKPPMNAAQIMEEDALNQLHHINQKEIAMGELAIRKATSPDVKSSAQTIIGDHRALEEQLKTTASQQSISPSEYSPSTYEKTAMSRLEQLEGAEFDRAFTNQMMLGHQQALDQLRVVRNNLSNPQITALIDVAVPKIQQHHTSTKRIADMQKAKDASAEGVAE